MNDQFLIRPHVRQYLASKLTSLRNEHEQRLYSARTEVFERWRKEATSERFRHRLHGVLLVYREAYKEFVPIATAATREWADAVWATVKATLEKDRITWREGLKEEIEGIVDRWIGADVPFTEQYLDAKRVMDTARRESAGYGVAPSDEAMASFASTLSSSGAIVGVRNTATSARARVLLAIDEYMIELRAAQRTAEAERKEIVPAGTAGALQQAEPASGLADQPITHVDGDRGAQTVLFADVPWENITFTFRGSGVVEITDLAGRKRRATGAELGFVDKRSGHLKRITVTLLGIAQGRRLTCDSNAARQSISKLRALLCKATGKPKGKQAPSPFRVEQGAYRLLPTIIDHSDAQDLRAKRRAVLVPLNEEIASRPFEREGDEADDWLSKNDPGCG